MESWLQTTPLILLIFALFIVLGFVSRYWRILHDETKNAFRRFRDKIRNAFPDLHLDIGNVGHRLRNELSRVFPVFSAEATENREAEFIGDRLPEDFPTWVVLLAIIIATGLAWYTTK